MAQSPQSVQKTGTAQASKKASDMHVSQVSKPQKQTGSDHVTQNGEPNCYEPEAADLNAEEGKGEDKVSMKL